MWRLIEMKTYKISVVNILGIGGTGGADEAGGG